MLVLFVHIIVEWTKELTMNLINTAIKKNPEHYNLYEMLFIQKVLQIKGHNPLFVKGLSDLTPLSVARHLLSVKIIVGLMFCSTSTSPSQTGLKLCLYTEIYMGNNTSSYIMLEILCYFQN